MSVQAGVVGPDGGGRCIAWLEIYDPVTRSRSKLVGTGKSSVVLRARKETEPLCIPRRTCLEAPMHPNCLHSLPAT